MKVEFFWEGVPPKSTFQQRDKNFHLSANAKLAMAQWKAILEQYVPEKKMEGPLKCRIVLIWPHTRQSKKEMDGMPVYKITRPDGINIMKGVEDIMTKLGYWNDDAQCVIETVERWHGDMSGVYMEVENV